jgi:hypothetical protein
MKQLARVGMVVDDDGVPVDPTDLRQDYLFLKRVFEESMSATPALWVDNGSRNPVSAEYAAQYPQLCSPLYSLSWLNNILVSIR